MLEKIAPLTVDELLDTLGGMPEEFPKWRKHITESLRLNAAWERLREIENTFTDGDRPNPVAMGIPREERERRSATEVAQWGNSPIEEITEHQRRISQGLNVMMDERMHQYQEGAYQQIRNRYDERRHREAAEMRRRLEQAELGRRPQILQDPPQPARDWLQE